MHTQLSQQPQRLRKHGSVVEVVGLNEHSRALVAQLDLGIE